MGADRLREERLMGLVGALLRCNVSEARGSAVLHSSPQQHREYDQDYPEVDR
jgi:hypothetical protein